MRCDDLTASDLLMLRRMLVEALPIWDDESPTLYGLSKKEVERVEAKWPICLEDDEFCAALAVNNVCADLLGGSNAISEALFPCAIGTNYSAVEILFRRLQPRLAAAIQRDKQA